MFQPTSGIRHLLLSDIKKQMKQVVKTFSMRKLVAYRIGIRQYWCKKEGNEGQIRRGNVIVLSFTRLWDIMFVCEI